MQIVLRYFLRRRALASTLDYRVFSTATQDEDFLQVDGLGVAGGVAGPNQGPGSKRQGPEESNHTP